MRRGAARQPASQPASRGQAYRSLYPGVTQRWNIQTLLITCCNASRPTFLVHNGEGEVVMAYGGAPQRRHRGAGRATSQAKGYETATKRGENTCERLARAATPPPPPPRDSPAPPRLHPPPSPRDSQPHATTTPPRPPPRGTPRQAGRAGEHGQGHGRVCAAGRGGGGPGRRGAGGQRRARRSVASLGGLAGAAKRR